MKKTIFSILGYLFFIQFLSAQITTNEAPFSFGSTPSQLLEVFLRKSYLHRIWR